MALRAAASLFCDCYCCWGWLALRVYTCYTPHSFVPYSGPIGSGSGPAVPSRKLLAHPQDRHSTNHLSIDVPAANSLGNTATDLQCGHFCGASGSRLESSRPRALFIFIVLFSRRCRRTRCAAGPLVTAFLTRRAHNGYLSIFNHDGATQSACCTHSLVQAQGTALGF